MRPFVHSHQSMNDLVPGLGTAAPLVPGLWSRPFMEPIPFPRGQASLDLSGLALLDDLAVALSWFASSCTIEVLGHAWEEGSPAVLTELSAQRAEVVRAALVQRGLPSWLLRVRGLGAERPASASPGADPKAACRRVEIWLHQRTVDTPLRCSDPGGAGCCRDC